MSISANPHPKLERIPTFLLPDPTASRSAVIYVFDVYAVMTPPLNATFNETLYNDPSLCTLETCPFDWATIGYIPSLAGNAFYLALFSLLLLVQTYFGVRYRSWSFMIALLGGEILEIIGYVARIQLHYNVFVYDSFLMYLICLTIAPCFLSAAIYLCLSRIIVVYGEHLARFKPRTYTVIFIVCDIFSLVLQSAGGAMADGGDQTGINIMIAGLACQVASLFAFMLLCADYARCVKLEGRGSMVRSRESVGRIGSSTRKVHFFVRALAAATVAIFVRSCFRVAELQEGFDGELANQQVTFMILEGAMVAIASIALTVAHPGLIFGHSWKLARARETVRSGSPSDSAVDNAKGTFTLHASEVV